MYDFAVKYTTGGNRGLKLSAENELKRLFKFATKNTHALFKGTFYAQIDGVDMGSPVATVLANSFMEHQALVVQKVVDNTIHRINHYPAGKQ